MAEFETTETPGSGLPAGRRPAFYKGTWEGDASTLVAPTGLVGVSGGEDARTFEGIPGTAANGLDVDVTRLPSLPAGTANIGDVDVLSVPADPFGTNADAAAAAGDVGSIQAKLRRITTQLAAIETSLAALDNGIAGNEFQVDIVSGGLTITRPGTVARSSVTITSSNIVAASNANRLGLVVTNKASTRALLKYGTTATTSDYDVAIDPLVTWHEPTGFTGRIDGILESGSGAVAVSEFTA
jgi:hypothetical protein